MARPNASKAGLRLEATDVAGFVPLVGTPFLISKLSTARGKLASMTETMKAVTLRQVADRYGETRQSKMATARAFEDVPSRLSGMERTPAPARVLRSNEYRLREAPRTRISGKVLTGYFGGQHRTIEGTEQLRSLRNRAARAA